MDKFWIVTLFHLQPTKDERLAIEEKALEMSALGIEEFSLTEPEVDELLGERSYSGGDLPQAVLDEVEETVLARPTNYRFFFDNANMARAFLDFTKTQLLCEIQIEECETEDWNAEWKKHYSPIKVNDQLTIIPSWLKDFKSDSKHEIYIYPGMGFGTGSHETTFLCLKLFTENCLSKKINTVLDFGSGSGILGLATFKFFKNLKVDFYDIDPEANKNCYQNAELNKLDEEPFRLLLPEVREVMLKSYDLVFANILESILLEEKDAIYNYVAPGGSLILSGLLKHQAPNVVQAYSSMGLHLKSNIEKGDWSALLFEKA
ncbi:MAG: 50S ribosomal protein L11 methyltransferase [Bacteriovoracaceae bacterium]